MKNIVMTLMMLLFVGATTTMAQSKTDVTATDAAIEHMEKTKAKHDCSASAKKACCAKKGATADKKACAPGCQKACCVNADGTVKEDHDHDGHDHDRPKE